MQRYVALGDFRQGDQMIKSVRLCVVVVAFLGSTSLIAPAASASETSTFEAVITEDFCARGVLCGTAVTEFGPATVRTVITSFSRLPSGCFSDHHTSTLTFTNGSTLAIPIAGTLCPTTFSNFTLTGTYTIDGGTGDFAGASGSGLVEGFRENGPVVSELSGTINVPANDE